MRSRCTLSKDTISSINSYQVIPITACGHSRLSDPCYSRFSAWRQSVPRIFRLLLCAILMLLSIGLSSGSAADIRYVKSPEIDLNVRQGPGTEHAAVARLPHGTPVFVQERVGLWLRVTAPDSGVEGWVLQRYLVLQPPRDPQELATFDPEKEQERFDRLQRRDIIRVRPNNLRGILQIHMNALIWNRLTPHEQANFLQRAHRLYKMNEVELRDRQTNKLRLRLVVVGQDNFQFDFIEAEPEAPSSQRDR